jgi:glutaminyl-tRNA synthetase
MSDENNSKQNEQEASRPSLDFIRTIIEADLKSGKNGSRVATRFPPEPNGYLHIGHAKSICINFGIAAQYGGACNLRYDDTNPTKEEVEYVESIQEDVHWLGFDWGGRRYFASDYFERLYGYAIELIRNGKAYVDSLSAEEIRAYRGTLTEPGKDSPYRNRTVEENLDLFERMRAGEFPDGSQVLRARIDMGSPNLNMRDPVIYRIRHASHHRTGDQWCVYPMYDFTHGLSDAIEGITHSICTLEFEDHRPLYDWFLDNLDVPCHPRQIEFARLNLNYTVMSKRKLLQLVEEGHVTGWNDPRMPTICGLRRRGYTPESVRAFCDRVGLAKKENVINVALLEHAVREDLNRRAPRVMCVLRPLRLVIDNYPEGKIEELQAVNNPEDPAGGTRTVPFTRELFIESEDFSENPPPKYFRLALGRTVRLRYSYLVTCTGVVKDESGNVAEVHCTYHPASLDPQAPDLPKAKATIHWVSAAQSVGIEARLYDRLFSVENPADESSGKDWKAHLNPDSLEVLTGCRAEPSLGSAQPGSRYQFERVGYFCADPDSVPGAPVFNRTVTLKDTWAKIQKMQNTGVRSQESGDRRNSRS